MKTRFNPFSAAPDAYNSVIALENYISMAVVASCWAGMAAHFASICMSRKRARTV